MKYLTSFLAVLFFVSFRPIYAQWAQTGFSGHSVYDIAVEGTYLFAAAYDAGLRRSSDNGATWTNVTPGQPYDTVRAVLAYQGKIYAAEPSEVYVSTDNGASWNPTGFSNSVGLYLTFNTLAAQDSILLVGVTGGGGMYRTVLGSNSWQRALTGQYTFTSINVCLSLTTSPNGFVFAAADSQQIYRSSDHGQTWTNVFHAPYPITGRGKLTSTEKGDVLYADSGSVFLSINNGQTWQRTNIIDRAFYSIAYDSNSHATYAGAEYYGVYRSTNEGTTWTSIGGTQFTSAQNPTSLLVSGTQLFAGTTSNGIYFANIISPISVAQISPLNTSTNQSLSPLLVWSIDSNATTYHLQVSNDSTFTSVTFDDSVLATSSQHPGTLEANTTYYWRVNSSNFLGTSAWSSTWHFTTHPIYPPNLASPPNGSANQPLPPTLSWNAAPYIASYRLQVSADSNFSSPAFDNSTITTTSQQIGALVSNTRYYWRAMTLDSGSTSVWSLIWHFTTYTLPPSNLSQQAGNRKITLSWLASSSPNIYKYKIYRGISSPILTLHDSTTTTSYTDTGLTNGTQYFYEITTENSSFLEGPFSSEVNATAFNQPPHAVSLQNVYEPNAGSVQLSLLNFSSAGSNDPDGTVDSIFWFINGSLISKQPNLGYNFAQGTNRVKLVVQDNQGARDSSFAIVNISKFKFQLNGPVYAGPSFLGNNILYVIGTGDAVYRLNSTGNDLYSLRVGGDVNSSSSISSDTTVYIASSDNNLYAFSKFGTSLWPALPLGGTMTATPAVDSITNWLYVGVSNKNFFAVNRTGGTVAWNYFVDAPIVGSAAITLDRKLVVATVKGTVYGFDLNVLSSSPTPSWQISLSDSIFGSPAIDASGNIYYCTTSGKVDKITMPANQQANNVWHTQVGGSITGSPVIDGNGTLYVGSADGKLYAIDIQSGNIKWSYPSGAPIFSTPTVSDVNLVYFGNHAGEVFAIDTNEVLHWNYQDSTSVDAPLLYNNGVLYAGTIGGRLIAFYDNADSSVRGSSMAAHLTKANSAPRVPVWGISKVIIKGLACLQARS